MVIVGRHEAGNLVRLERRVDDDDRDPLGDRLLDRLDQGPASSGARTIPSTPEATAFCTSLIWSVRSSSRGGPCQTISTLPRASAAFDAPAWTDCQNSCVVPFGITITRHFFVFAPPFAESDRPSTLGGWSTASTSGFLQVLGRDQRLAGRDLRLDRPLLEDVDHRSGRPARPSGSGSGPPSPEAGPTPGPPADRVLTSNATNCTGFEAGAVGAVRSAAPPHPETVEIKPVASRPSKAHRPTTARPPTILRGAMISRKDEGPIVSQPT